jgi:methyl acetate hydrolase
MRHEGLPSIVTCVNASLRAPLLFEPGGRWEYGVGIDWVGKIVEAEWMKPRGLSAGQRLRAAGHQGHRLRPAHDMKRRLVVPTQRAPTAQSRVSI